MPRSSSFRAALAGLLTLGSVGMGLTTGTGAAAAATVEVAPAKAEDPLVVHLDTISPELPRKGDVEITGTVTNVGDETFTRVNLHAFASQTPILNSPSLAVSATTGADEFVGERVTTPGTFATIDVLEPGASAPFSDSVPVELFETTGQAGVYWIGVHALGDTETTPRDGVADGRARTFIPMRPQGKETQSASVILPIRNRVWFTEDGRVAGTERWARRFAEGGSLDGVLDMAESAGSTPYSWLVDPAVLLAVMRLTEGNPPRSIAPDPSVPGQEPTAPPTAGDDTAAPSPEQLTPTAPTDTDPPSEEEAQLAAAASVWLARFREIVGPNPVLTLPYGDIDVSAAMRHDRSRFDQATARSAEIMASLGIVSTPTVAPTSDVLSPEAIAAIPADTLIMLGDTAAFAFPPRSPSSVVRVLGHDILVTSTGAESGGPLPTAANDPLALRQRLLSEAALRLVDGDTAPLVVTLPTVWRGEDAASFFTDLEQPWLDVVPLGEVTAGSAKGVPASRIAYTDEDVAEELDASSFAAASGATDAAALLEQVLASVTKVEAYVRDEVLVTLSEAHRARPRLARAAAQRTEDSLRDALGRIRIEAPTAVTLSSDSGPLGATLVNGLDQPVEVQVQASTDGQLTLTGGGTRTLGPKARSVVRFEATAEQGGVHKVRLAVTSLDGAPLGSSAQLPIRAARVSALIWIVMAVGGLVLFGMIGYRLPGQIRARRKELREAEPSSGPAPGDPIAGPVPERP